MLVKRYKVSVMQDEHVLEIIMYNRVCIVNDAVLCTSNVLRG